MWSFGEDLFGKHHIFSKLIPETDGWIFSQPLTSIFLFVLKRIISDNIEWCKDLELSLENVDIFMVHFLILNTV